VLWVCEVHLVAYACGSSLVAIECRYSRKACLRHWTALNCLIIKALDKTRTYLAPEQGLSLNRIFIMSWPLKLAHNWNMKAFLSGWVCEERLFCLLRYFPIPLLPYCLLKNLKIPKNRPLWNVGIARVSEVLGKPTVSRVSEVCSRIQE